MKARGVVGPRPHVPDAAPGRRLRQQRGDGGRELREGDLRSAQVRAYDDRA